MYRSFTLILVLVVSLTLCQANPQNSLGQQPRSQHAVGPLNEGYNLPPPNRGYGSNTRVLNIGNGHHRTNVVDVVESEDGVEVNGVSYKDQGNRNPEFVRHGSLDVDGLGIARNIGNGHNNRNTVTIIDHDRGSVFTQTDDGRRPGEGLSFRSRSSAGTDDFNIGYGRNNNNRVIIENNRRDEGRDQGSQQPPEAKTAKELYEISIQLRDITNRLTEILKTSKV